MQATTGRPFTNEDASVERKGSWCVYRDRKARKSFTRLAILKKYGGPHVWVVEERRGGFSLGIGKREVSHFPGRQKAK